MKFWRFLSLTLLAISVLGLMGTSYAANTDGMVTFTVNTANYTANYSPNNVAVVWVVDSSNRFVKTLCRHARTRINYLLQWNASRGSYTNVDGVTSSTLTSQPQTHAVTWNCRDTNNAVVPDGTYYFRVEYTSANGQGPYITNWCRFVKGPTAVTTNYPNLNSSGGLFSGMSLTYTPAAPPAGDIAVTDMSPTIGIANSNVIIQVTVVNQAINTVSFSVTLSNVTSTAILIGSQSVNNLAGGASTTVTFNWNTTGLAAGSYRLKATAAPLVGEVNTANNVMTNTVTLTAPDEINMLIARGSIWKYLDAGLDISGAPWTSAVNYDDGFWASGPAPLGYGLSNIATTVNYGGNATNRYTTTYFRREFIVDFAPVTINSRVRRADGVVLYLNGVEIVRQNMPAGSVEYGTAASFAASAADATNYFSFTLAASNLVIGRNLLAAELHKSAPANAGLGFDFELSAVNPTVTRNYRVSPIAVLPDGAVQAGDVLGVSVTLTNQGNVSTAFTILLKDAASGAVLASKQIGSLAPGETTVVHLTWPTIGATPGTRTLQAVAIYNNTTNWVDVPTASVSIPALSFAARKVNAVSSIGGRCNAVAASGNYVYLGCGAALEIWDVTQPSMPLRIGSLRLPGIIESLTVGSGWVYAAAGASGVQIVDVRSPSAPVHVATYDSSGHARRLNLSGNRLYLADVLGGVRILDVSNPTMPILVGAYQTASPAQAVAFSGQNLLVLDGHDGLQILQSTNPVPTVLGTLRKVTAGLSLAVGSGMALAGDANGRLFRINIATPATPTVITNVLLPAPGCGLALAGSALYVAAGPAGLLTLRSDTLATAATHAISGGDAADVAVNTSNTTLYVAAGFAGCQAWNITGTPLTPRLLSVFGNGSRPVDTVASGTTLLIAGDEGGLQVHSLSNLSLPTWLANVSGVTNPRSVAVSGGRALVADANGRLTILNVSNAIAPSIIGSYIAPGLGMIRRLAVAGTRAALTDGKQIQLLSIANPATPVLIATNVPGGFVFDLAASTSYLFAACGGAGLHTYDLAGLNPVGTYRTPGPAVGVTINGSYAHVAIGTNGWQTLNISNPTAPALVQTSAGTTFGIAAAGSLVHVIDGQGSAKAMNVTAPLTPVTIQTFINLTRTLRVGAAGNLILASEDEAGLALLNSGSTSINLSTTNLSPHCAVGQNATGQYFDVWSSGGGIMSFTVSDNADWLSVSPASGTSTGEHDRIAVTYNTAALTAGTYTALITIINSSALGASATIPVTLTVSAMPTTPTLSVSVTSLSVSCPVGQDEVSQSFDVWNSGGGTLTYRVSDNADWLETSPSDGTSASERDTIIATFHVEDVGAGTHTATITVTSPNGTGSPKTIPVMLTVNTVTEPIVVDNANATGVTIVGTWTGSTNTPGYWRTNYLHDGNTGKGTKSVTFRPTLPSAGNYEVSIWYTAGANRATNVPMDIVYSGGTRTVRVNERVNGGRWVVLGTNTFAAGANGYVRIRTAGTTSGYVIADAVRFMPVAVTEAIVDNADVTGVAIVGTWTGSTSSPGYWRTNYLHDGNTGKGTKSVTFRPTLPSAGNYEVSIWYTAGANRATNVPMDIVYSGGTRTVRINERVNGGRWVVLGTNMFVAGTNGCVRIRTTGTSGYVVADAVRFVSINSGLSGIAKDSREAISLDLVTSTAGSVPDDMASQFAVRWYSIEGRTYTLYRTTDLLTGWTAVKTNIDATPPINSYTDTTSLVRGYYMVVEQ